jgi:uncharacterized membrane protein
MSNKEHITGLLDYFQNTEGKPLIFDEDAIVSAYQKDSDNQSLPIKILSVFGGILASLAFLGFLLIAGLHNSEMGLLVFGSIFIAGSIWISKKYDRIIIDTVSVSSFIIGFILTGLGLYELRVNEDMTSIIFIIIAFGSLWIVQNYILSFIAVLIINGSFLMLILSNNAYNLIHVQVAVLALAMVYFFLKEAQIIAANNIFSKLYNPVRTGIMFSFLAGLLLLGKRGVLPISPDYIWMSSIITIASIVYLISKIFNVLSITETRHKASIYLFVVLTLLPTALSPAISGAILIILLSFLVNYKTGLVIGIISFIYFISQYYYDLNFTLLTKSILLLASGVLFIALYLFTHKKLTTNEKI